ncbi:MAG: Biopolymer transport protein ExbD [Candidatus Anoxychlamydiales bacterium]|nr:Biopolymer transport protein ExbD [Candidatus Anoxychlamydiales bacterium]NGX48518.1 Biopolymer transport protein ExbD [Candidatus Anoxychlamydiales bacterium]
MRKKKFLQNSSDLDENLINLTPLIDVVFVVLISFILIAPLLEVDHINLAEGSTKSDKNIEQTSIVLKVKEDNSILINNRLVTLLELKDLLKEKKRSNPNQIPQLYHDKKATFGSYQSIKNLVELSGFEKLDVVLQPD